jgi:outer membrane protein TolC
MKILFQRKIKLCLIAVVTVIFGAVSVNALSLQEARELALQNNLLIKASKEKILETQSLREEQDTTFYPTFSLYGYGMHQDNIPEVVTEAGSFGTFLSSPVPSTDVVTDAGEEDNYYISVKMEQPVFAGGKIYYSYKLAEAHEEWAHWNDQQVMLNVLFKVEETFFNLLKAEETKKFVNMHEKTLKAHLEDMELRYEKGRVSLNEILKVKVEVSRASEMVIKADNAVLVAKTRLNTVLNRPVDQPLAANPVEDIALITFTLKEAERLAILNHPSLKSANKQIQEAAYNTQISEADYYPEVKFIAEYYNQTDQPVEPEDNWYVMLAMNWPFWQWGKTGHKVSSARAIERQAEYRFSELKNNILADVHQAWLQLQEADKRIDVSKEAMVQAEENLRITQLGFTHGVKTSTDLLEAEDLQTETQSEYIQAKYDAYFARTTLRYVMGTIEQK